MLFKNKHGIKYYTHLLLLAIITGVFAHCKKPVYSDQIVRLELNQDVHKKTFKAPIQLSLTSNIDETHYKATMNGKPLHLIDPILVEDAGFYELILSNKTTAQIDTFTFVLLAANRGDSEWGLPEWTPADFETQTITSENIEFIYPKIRYADIPVPICLKITKPDGSYKSGFYSIKYNNEVEYVKHGMGSINLDVANNNSSINLNVGSTSQQIILNNLTSDTIKIPSVINDNYTIPSNSIVILDNDLTISETGKLNINEGCLVLIREAVNIYNFGDMTVQGTKSNPIYFTSKTQGKLWGGFINSGNHKVNIQYGIFTASGYHTSAEYQWGHAKQQALFYIDNTNFTISNSCMIDNSGQIFYSTDAKLSINNCLVQRAKTGGQQNNTELEIKDCHFMDFPIMDKQYLNEDNDALYLSKSNANISNSYFMFAKDDGIDSGASAGGEVNISNCHFEGIFHEGIAMSSGGSVIKKHTIKNCTFTNCGQGIELGYSSNNHSVFADSCIFYNNAVGIRYGDNYTWDYAGTMYISNSSIYNNAFKDVWNMVHTEWTGYYENLTFFNVSVSQYNSHYPDLNIID